jgi:hypothetical protein
MDTIATGFATHAPIAAGLFASAFVHAGAWAQFFTIAFFLKKFGFFKWVGAQAATYFIKPFLSAFGTAFIGAIGGETLAGSLGTKIAAGSATAGKAAGKLFGAAFLVGLLLLLPEITKEMDKIAERYGFNINKPNTKEEKTFGKTTGILEPWIRANIPGANALYEGLLDRGSTGPKRRRPARTGGARGGLLGGATGGVIPTGVMSLVGENGPEVAQASPWGTRITPLSGNSRHSLPGAIGLPDLQDAMRIHLTTSVQVDKREIGRAVDERVAYVTARRSGTPPRQEG